VFAPAIASPAVTRVGPRIAIATCRESSPLDEDAPLLLGALHAAGIDATEQVWDDPDVDWASFDMVVVRSTWDYALRRDEFLDWAERVGAVTELRNPASVIRWNTDKRYLADLDAAGVQVVPTTFLLPGEVDVLGKISSVVLPSRELVVKPTVSAGSKDTVRYAALDEDPSAPDAAGAHAAALLAAGRPVMVQPYLSAVDTAGETGLVFLGGRFSHAFRKGPLLQVGNTAVAGLYAEEAISPRTPSEAELAVGEQTLAAFREITGVDDELYARVDLVPGDDGAPVLLELELTEPSFFLATSDGAATRATAAILAALA